MGRAEKRKAERYNRIEKSKEQVVLSRRELTEMREKLSQDVLNYNVEALMTCFALAEHRMYGFGKKRILRSLQYIDDLMGDVNDGKATIEDYKRELEEKTTVAIKC